AIMPGIQGGPLMHIIAAKAVAFKEALEPEFSDYCGRVIENAAALAEAFMERDYQVVTGGTDTHVVLIDLSNKQITGKVAEAALERAGMTVNKNMVPFDRRSPFVTSGIRLGSPALTTRGMGTVEMKQIVALLDKVITAPDDDKISGGVLSEVAQLSRPFPLYAEMAI
ncbi:MAG: serine hydroxymethyltransferase, partial [Candidatus Marinimicrobia bacterium]|nr:serine hydroxymethyltransferase [Candidatus Neomarinimicrobiota bacterium]